MEAFLASIYDVGMYIKRVHRAEKNVERPIRVGKSRAFCFICVRLCYARCVPICLLCDLSA